MLTLGKLSIWTVEDCIMATMAGHVQLWPDPNDPNIFLNVSLPSNATAGGTCDLNRNNKPTPNQLLSLSWIEKTPHGTDLIRNFTLLFSINMTSQMYGVSRVSAVYETKHEYIQTLVEDNKTESFSSSIHVKEFIVMTTFQLDPWEFQVPLGKSYSCEDAGSFSLHTVLHKSTDPRGDPGIKLESAVIHWKDFQIDAFRLWTTPYEEFQSPMDCEVGKHDIVPIVVGLTLFALVLAMLIAYFIYKREKEEEQLALVANLGGITEEEEEDQSQDQEQPSQEVKVEPILTDIKPDEPIGEADSDEIPVTDL